MVKQLLQHDTAFLEENNAVVLSWYRSYLYAFINTLSEDEKRCSYPRVFENADQCDTLYKAWLPKLLQLVREDNLEDLFIRGVNLHHCRHQRAIGTFTSWVRDRIQDWDDNIDLQDYWLDTISALERRWL